MYIPKGKTNQKQTEEKTMTNIIERTSKVYIDWTDGEYEYTMSLTGREAREFEESYAEDYAIEEAAEQGKNFEEVLGISYETEFYDNSEDEKEYWMEFNRED